MIRTCITNYRVPVGEKKNELATTATATTATPAAQRQKRRKRNVKLNLLLPIMLKRPVTLCYFSHFFSSRCRRLIYSDESYFFSARRDFFINFFATAQPSSLISPFVMSSELWKGSGDSTSHIVRHLYGFQYPARTMCYVNLRSLDARECLHGQFGRQIHGVCVLVSVYSTN